MKSVTAVKMSEFLRGSSLLGVQDVLAVKPCSLTPGENGGLSFCKYETGDAVSQVTESKSSIILCSNKILWSVIPGKALLLVDDPRLAFIKIISEFLSEEDILREIHPTAIIHPTACIGAYCTVAENCQIGANSIIYPNVTLYKNTKIGKNVTIHSGTVIGADGFAFYPDPDNGNCLMKFPHMGGVVIEDDVEIGSNTSVDRGALDNTVIGKGTKIDNLVHVAHNIHIGERCRIICHSALGGSITIGDDAYIGIAASIKNQKKIGKGALIGMGAVVTKDVESNTVVIGNPAHPK